MCIHVGWCMCGGFRAGCVRAALESQQEVLSYPRASASGAEPSKSREPVDASSSAAVAGYDCGCWTAADWWQLDSHRCCSSVTCTGFDSSRNPHRMLAGVTTWGHGSGFVRKNIPWCHLQQGSVWCATQKKTTGWEQIRNPPAINLLCSFPANVAFGIWTMRSRRD